MRYDEFGFCAEYQKKISSYLTLIMDKYFKLEVSGIENIPDKEKAIIVSNHAGFMPWDALMIQTAILKYHKKQRLVKPLMEDFVFSIPFLGVFIRKLGAVSACQENAEKLLKAGDLILTFPEGIKGLTKTYFKKYEIQRFGRGGLIRLAIRTGSKVIASAIIGIEEASPVFFKFEKFSSFFGLPFIPITPTFPLLGPIGLIPYPVKLKIKFDPPVEFKLKKSENEDSVIIGKLNEELRTHIQEMIYGLREKVTTDEHK